jgi:formylmethanofuran dehydrogenase subunit D
MLFVDYVFDVLENGTIIMDKELDAKKLNIKDGDKYVVNVTFDGRIVFQKIKPENT